VELHDFRQRVREQFGPRMERATPASIRDFLIRIQSEFSSPRRGPIVINQDPAHDFDDVIGDFFSRVLDLPLEKAVMLLWLLAVELHYARLEEEYEERFSSLFRLGE
jgi:hypothetical protein